MLGNLLRDRCLLRWREKKQLSKCFTEERRWGPARWRTSSFHPHSSAIPAVCIQMPSNENADRSILWPRSAFCRTDYTDFCGVSSRHETENEKKKKIQLFWAVMISVNYMSLLDLLYRKRENNPPTCMESGLHASNHKCIYCYIYTQVLYCKGNATQGAIYLIPSIHARIKGCSRVSETRRHALYRKHGEPADGTQRDGWKGEEAIFDWSFAQNRNTLWL